MSLPVGGLMLHSDPTTPEKVSAEEVEERYTPEPGEVDVSLEGDAISLALGVDTQFHYSYFFTDAFGIDFGVNARARQSTLDGPGKRFTNVYLNASNIDTSFGFSLGARFLF